MVVRWQFQLVKKLPTTETPAPDQASDKERVNEPGSTSKTDNADALSNNDNAVFRNFLKRGDQLTANQFGDEYEILEAIGMGAVCTVYSVRSKSLGQNFALRGSERRSRFKCRRAPTVQQRDQSRQHMLPHQNVAPIYGHGHTSKGAPFIVQHLCEGSNLAQIIRNEGRQSQLEH